MEGSTLTKLHLIEHLGLLFKNHKEVKKYTIEKVLGEVASKVGGKWKINEDAKVCILVASLTALNPENTSTGTCSGALKCVD